MRTNVSILGLVDLGLRLLVRLSILYAQQVSILGLVDLGLRLNSPLGFALAFPVSILGLVDLGLRLQLQPLIPFSALGFNPWFSGFRVETF